VCTIIQEYAHSNGETPSGRKQVIYFSGTRVDIHNSIVYIESSAGDVDAFSYAVWGQDQLYGDYNCYKINQNLYAYDAGADPETYSFVQWQNSKSRELNSLGDNVDPKFITEVPYKLFETSPCIDACPEVDDIEIDIDNNTRPVKVKNEDTPYDIGCYEHGPISPRYEIIEKVGEPVVGICEDGSRRVYIVKDDEEIMHITRTMDEDEWAEFKKTLEEARYRKNTFEYITGKGEVKTVRLLDESVEENLIGVDMCSNKNLYKIKLTVRVKNET
jgi:hypothetical protein